MTTELIVVRPEIEVHQAVALLLEHRISGLPVVDADGALVGIITEQDCLRVVFQSDYYQDAGRRVADAMTHSPETIDADDDIMTAIDLFLHRPFRRFPVVRDGILVGILSRREALRLVKEQA
jgi:CBS domain-containing protein